MAVSRATCWIGGWDLTGVASSARLGLRRAELDRTAVSDDHTRTVAGLRAGRLEAAGFLDEPADDALPLNYYSRGDVVVMSVVPDGAGGVGDKARVFEGRIQEWRHTGRVGQLRQWDLSAVATEKEELPGPDPVLAGTVLDHRDMVTPATDQPSKTLPFEGVKADGTLWAAFHLFALADRTTVRLKVQTRTGSTTWTDRLTFDAQGPPFTDPTTVGVYVKTAAGAIVHNEIQTLLTISGTNSPHACLGVVYGVV